MSHTQRWRPICPRLRRVQEVARAKPKEKFTSLAHLLTVEALRRSYQRLKADASPGIDGVTKKVYGQDLEQSLLDLHGRLRRGRYRASPVRRCWLEKPEGGLRPLGIPTLEDKIVQGAVAEILSAVYEVDFLGLSYGSRPGRSAHQAIQALQTVLQKGKVSWVLDADMSKFFDSIDHKELMSAVGHRVTDRGLLRLIGKWLAVGVVEEDGRRIRSRCGTPQGGVISPVLANIFLHYVVDVYVHEWRRAEARGEVYIVRYMDDFVIACESEEDARQLRSLVELRLGEYGLELNREKTRLVRFGRRWSGGDKGNRPGTFDFLGFTHVVGRDRQGRYLVVRKTSRKRLRRSLKEMVRWCKKHRHQPLQWQWRQLSGKLTGHFNYYGIRGNSRALRVYQYRVWRHWFRALRRRSQKERPRRLYKLLNTHFVLPRPRITHPEGWLAVNPGDLLGRAGCGNAARPAL